MMGKNTEDDAKNTHSFIFLFVLKCSSSWLVVLLRGPKWHRVLFIKNVSASKFKYNMREPALSDQSESQTTGRRES